MKDEYKKATFTLSKPIVLTNKEPIKNFKYASDINTEDLEYLLELYEGKKNLVDFMRKGVVYISDLTLEDVNLMNSNDLGMIGKVVQDFLLTFNTILTSSDTKSDS